MRKKILEHLRTGRIREAAATALDLCSKKRDTYFYNELVLISGRLHRAERDYLFDLISLESRERIESCASKFIVENFTNLKKKHFSMYL